MSKPLVLCFFLAYIMRFSDSQMFVKYGVMFRGHHLLHTFIYFRVSLFLFIRNSISLTIISLSIKKFNSESALHRVKCSFFRKILHKAKFYSSSQMKHDPNDLIARLNRQRKTCSHRRPFGKHLCFPYQQQLKRK